MLTSIEEASAVSSVRDLIRRAAHLLPSQGPIGVFVHHNTLHAFEHLPFEEAVVQAAKLHGAEPFMPEAAYDAEYRRGRIRAEDIESVLAREPDTAIVPGRIGRRELRRRLLLTPPPEIRAATLEWDLEEGALRSAIQHSLFDGCAARMARMGLEDAASQQGTASRLANVHDAIHPLLIRLCGAFLDQGMAYWPMPLRDQGFYRSVRELFGGGSVLEQDELRGLSAEFCRQQGLRLCAEDAIVEALRRLDGVHSNWASIIDAELLALAGWAGMFHQLEEQPELAPHVLLPVSLEDYLAVRLTLLQVAVTHVVPDDDGTGDAGVADLDLGAARLAVALPAVGLTETDLAVMTDETFARLANEIWRFDSLERRRVLHLAYERRHERQVLVPLRTHRGTRTIGGRVRSFAQVFFCLDEREESIRRHLEEADPEIETFGAAGFFGLAIDFQGIDDAYPAPFCPVVIEPRHAIRERPVSEHVEVHARRKAMRRALARFSRGIAVGSRALVRGWIATCALGVASLAPLTVRVLNPLLYSRLVRWLNSVLVPRTDTELAFTRQSGDFTEGMAQGFTIAEQADRVGGLLKDAGLCDGFARLVVILGHGSTSLNNPHESAHDCGACGGRRGGANARLFADMANHAEVREELLRRGVVIPADTWFVGGYHDTCNDEVQLYDTHRVPPTHARDLQRLQTSLDAARSRNAFERSRRFDNFSLSARPGAALRHVQERAEHLAEPRPEYGHCTNAVCIIGRREITRGLFLDRRAFLTSYDATQDTGDESLARLLSAVVPVCAGISLEYYFSFVDNERYGCGTKLPHNVTALIGVMNGAGSDLRTGLPWQMVEIHEPVRLLLAIETTPERLSNALTDLAGVRRLIENRWMRVATIDPADGAVHVYRNGAFELLDESKAELPQARSSLEFCRKGRDYLPLAAIRE